MRFFEEVGSGRSTSMKRDLAQYDVGIAPVSKKWVVLLLLTAPSLMADVMVDNVVAENVSEHGM